MSNFTKMKTVWQLTDDDNRLELDYSDNTLWAMNRAEDMYIKLCDIADVEILIKILKNIKK